jgi:hypothetical protein
LKKTPDWFMLAMAVTTIRQHDVPTFVPWVIIIIRVIHSIRIVEVFVVDRSPKGQDALLNLTNINKGSKTLQQVAPSSFD